MIERMDQTITLENFINSFESSVIKKNIECGKNMPPCIVSYVQFRRIESGKIPCPKCGLDYEQHI